ncbi:MAG TPA: type II secretion system protein [Patescibacteria group bacterium]|nr:type II secretion system protein [Patescibacteria group bacterium]
MKMRFSPSTTQQAGYTLIELLLYVAIIGTLLTAVVFFFSTTTDARVKNQTILEVNDQGTALMDSITQVVHNATSITAPSTGTSAPSLTLVVPTGTLSPTVFSLSGTTLGYSTMGTTTDSSDSGSINATKFVASASGTVSTLYSFVGATVAASPNNKAQMAIYSGTSSPTTLLASSASNTLMANSWNAFTISPVTVTSGQTYWIAYNTNGLVAADNDLKDHTGTTNQSMFTSQTFGTWPASWTGTNQSIEFSMYAMIDTTATPGTVQIKEGAGALVSLTSNDVQLSGLTFKNLSRASTPGAVQISFVLSRVNPSNKTEFDYQRTFTTTAEVGW